MSDVFISYSRKDIAFARLIQESLQANDLDAWIDWDRIPVGEKWWLEICQAIENANVFMFIISKTSIGSSVCKDEINHALKNNKRIIPIIVDNLKPESIKDFAPGLPQYNWIIFEKDRIFQIEENPEVKTERSEDNQVALPKLPQFEDALEKLSQAIHTDWEWVKYHTRLQVNALLWEDNQHESGYELRGAALLEAEQQLLQAGGKEPHPTLLQVDYVSQSRTGENQRLEEQLRLEKKARQRQKMVIWAVGIGMFAASILGVIAWLQRNLAQEQRNIAQEQRNIAVSRQLKAQALSKAENQYDLAVLLSMESDQFLENPPSFNSNLFEILQTSPRLITFLRGFENHVTSVAVSPDGLTLAVASGDSTIHLWDISAPDQPLPLGQPLSGHTSGVFTVAFSSDGRLLASGGGDNLIILWDLESLEAPKILGAPLSGHKSTLRCLAFSPNGRTLASGSYDTSIKLWDVSNPVQPRLVGELENHDDIVSSLAFSPDGERLASVSYDGTMILWNLKDPQNAEFAWSSANYLFDKKLQSQDYSHLQYWLTSVAFSPDGELIATSDYNHAFQIWKVDELLSTKAIPLIDFSTEHTSEISAVAFSPDGDTLATGSLDHTIRLWDVSKPNEPVHIRKPLTGHSYDVSSLVFTPDGKTLISGSWDQTAILWDVENLALPHFLGDQLFEYEGVFDGVMQVALSPDGRLLASANADNTFSLWDLSNHEQPIRVARPQVRFFGAVNSVDFCSNDQLLATGSDDSSIILWDVSKANQPTAIGLPLIGHEPYVYKVAFSPDCKLLISSDMSEKIILWDIRDPSSPRPIGQPLAGLSFAFSPDGRYLALGGYDKPVHLTIWDIQTPEAPQLLADHKMDDGEPILNLAFSPDGNLLASGRYDGKIYLWDVSEKNELISIGQPFSNQKDIIRSVAFSPDGRILVSGSDDHTITLWDISNPQSPVSIGQPLSNHSGGVLSVVFSQDGNELFSSSQDTTIIRWKIELNNLNKLACQIAARSLNEVEWEQYLPEGEPYRVTCQEYP